MDELGSIKHFKKLADGWVWWELLRRAYGPHQDGTNWENRMAAAASGGVRLGLRREHTLLFEAMRINPKIRKQFFPDQKDGWYWTEEGVPGLPNIVAQTVLGKDGRSNHPTNQNTVAFTVGTDLRGQPYKLHTETLIAKDDPDGKGTITGVSGKMDSLRGVIIGNAVSIPVAKWLGERILTLQTERRGR